MLPQSRRPFGHWGICSFAAQPLLTAQQTYDQLKDQADKFGYCTLSREERLFLKRFKAHNDAGALTTSERVGKKRQATWSGTSASGAPKRRQTRRARVWVDKSVATWKAPTPQAVVGVTAEQLLSAMPAEYTRMQQHAC